MFLLMAFDEDPDDPNDEYECPSCGEVMVGEYESCPFCSAFIAKLGM